MCLVNLGIGDAISLVTEVIGLCTGTIVGLPFGGDEATDALSAPKKILNSN